MPMQQQKQGATNMPDARPDNSHLYAEAYAEVKALAEALTCERTPVIPRTTMACALLEVVREIMADPLGHIAREAVAEDACATFGLISKPLPFALRSRLDAALAEMLGGS